MGIDASIYSQMQAPDILGNVARGLTMRDMMDQRALQKKELAEQEGIKKAFGAGMVQGEDGKMQFDQQKTLGQLAQVNPQKAFEFQEQMSQVALEKEQQQRKKQLEQLDLTSRLLGSVSDQSTYEQAMMTARKMGLDVDGLPRTYDPGFVRTAQLQSLSAKEQLEHQLKSQGHDLKTQAMAQDEDRFNRTHGLRERELGLKKEQMQMKGRGGPGGPKISTDYMWNEDGTAVVPIPGSKAARELERQQQDAEEFMANLEVTGQMVVRDVTTAIDTINKYGRTAAGWGSTLSRIPESQAKNLARDIDSIRGNIAVDQLLNIKKSGAGLGQVPHQQLVMLSSLLGGIDQDMDPQKLKQNLDDIRDIYSDIVKRSGGNPYEKAIKRGWDPENPDRPLPDLGSSRGSFRPQSRGSRPQQRQNSPMPAQPMQVSPEMRRGALEELARRRQMAGQTPRGE